MTDAGLPRTNTVAIGTTEGPMRAILVVPAAGKGPWPAVITFPHVGGLTDTMRTMAEIVARGGYLSVVPDLYHRLGTLVIDPQSQNPDVVAIRKIAASSVKLDGALGDCGAVLDWLGRSSDWTGQCATLGYGRGGSLALKAAATYPQQVAAAASILGFGFDEGGDDPARDWLRRLRCPIYCAFAEQDDIIPAQVPERLKVLVAETGADARIVVHAGALHPYIFPDRTVHDPRAAAQDWGAVFALFRERLGA